MFPRYTSKKSGSHLGNGETSSIICGKTQLSKVAKTTIRISDPEALKMALIAEPQFPRQLGRRK